MAYEMLEPAGRYELLPPEKPADATTRTERLARGLRDPVDGGAQLLTNLLPDGVVQAGNRLNNFLADKTGLVGRLPDGGVDQQVREAEAAYQSRRGENAGTFDGWRLTGNVANPANVAIAARTPQAVSALGRIGVGAGGGAASAALAPVAGDGAYADEKMMQMGAGAVGGGLTAPVVGALSRTISPNASINPNVQLLRRENVRPTVGQALGGWANRAEEKAMSLPIVGDAISHARESARTQFNQAAINRALQPIGKKASGTGQEAVKDAGDLIGDAYDQAKNALGTFRIDKAAATELANLRMLAKSGLEGRERKTVEGYFKDYLQKPALTAQAFKELDSKLAKDIGDFAGSSDVYQQKVGAALKEVRRIVTDNAKRANPQAAQMMKKADTAYANLVRVEGASKSAMNTGGVFTPGQLNTAVRQSDRSVRDRATARGTALMQDLGNAGQQVLGNKVPNSGTADRLWLGGAGLGSYFVDPLIPAGLLAGAGLYSSPMQGLLRIGVASRPQAAKGVADALRKASPALVPLGAQMGLGLLN